MYWRRLRIISCLPVPWLFWLVIWNSIMPRADAPYMPARHVHQRAGGAAADQQAIAGHARRMGRIMSIRPQLLPVAGGFSGGGSSTRSPDGSSGAGRRDGRLTIIVPKTEPPVSTVEALSNAARPRLARGLVRPWRVPVSRSVPVVDP